MLAACYSWSHPHIVLVHPVPLYYHVGFLLYHPASCIEVGSRLGGQSSARVSCTCDVIPRRLVFPVDL